MRRPGRGRGAILVSIPKSLRADAAQLELDLYLRVWEATHPQGRTTRLGR
jgi:hypothetical protein